MDEELDYREFKSPDILHDFKCGVEVMDKFLHNPADLVQSLTDNECTAYTVHDAEGQLVGFFALNMDILDLDDDDREDLTHGYSRADAPSFKTEKEFEEFMSQPRFKVVDIAYLAVPKKLQGRGIGTAIMNKIFDMAVSMNPDGLFITVDALHLRDGSHSAVEFYEIFNFQRILPPHGDTIRMYCTVK